MATSSAGFELLLNLGVDNETSRNNINNYIRNLRNLDDVRIDLNVNGTGSSNQELQRLQSTVRDLRAEVTRLGNDLSTTERNGARLGNSLTSAFSKFPAYLLVSSTYYGAIRGIGDITEKVIELDSALVNLQRVSDGSQFEYDTVISRTVENVTALSGTVSSYLELLNEFARNGNSIDESFDLANTTQVLTNISDLTASESFDALTAAMLSFNIEAEDSVRIADRLNEVDNNYSITTQDLALSLNKAASTASTFGVSLDDLIGQTTAKLMAFLTAMLSLNFLKRGNTHRVNPVLNHILINM